MNIIAQASRSPVRSIGLTRTGSISGSEVLAYLVQILPGPINVPIKGLRSATKAGIAWPTSFIYASGPPARRWMLCAEWPGTRGAIRAFRFVRLAGERCDILCELGSVWRSFLPAIVPPLAMPLRHDIAAVTANGRVVVSLAVRSNCHFIECPAMRALKFEETWCSWRHGQNQKPRNGSTN